MSKYDARGLFVKRREERERMRELGAEHVLMNGREGKDGRDSLTLIKVG